MATVSLKNLHQDFSIENAILPAYYTSTASTTTWTYQGPSVTSPRVTVKGSDFHYSGGPSSGTVSSFAIDLDPSHSNGAELTVSGLAAAFGRLNYSGSDYDLGSSYYYAVMLDGDDTIDLGTNASKEYFHITFAADGTWATTFGGNDKVRGDVGDGGKLSGDLTIVKFDYSRYGGDDDIRLSGSYNAVVVGDAFVIAGSGTLGAGDDYISISKKGFVYGDVEESAGNLRGGDDTIMGSYQDDRLVGDVGELHGGTTLRGGNDSIHGGDGADRIDGDVTVNGSTVVKGGHDRLYGDRGNDTIFGNAGDDTIYGGADKDELYGDQGNDWLRGDSGKDTIYGGDGIDTVDYGDKTTKVSLTYKANIGEMVTVTVNGAAEDLISAIENVNGGSAGDKINGGTGDIDNRFDGRSGSDTLSGGGGDDTLIGGAGNDRLTGGADKDQFRFTVSPGSANIDTITDFKHGEDKIALDDAIFKALGSSVTSDEFGAKASGHAASDKQHIIYDKSNGTLWYDADDNGSGKAVQIAQLGTSASHPTNLSYSDFVIV